jgi:aminomethyltransferase
VEAANTTGLWSHWAGYLVAEKYQMSEKFEYFAVRNAVGMFDTSPLYKYLVSGQDAERFLAGVLARNIRKCRPGQAQYTVWCDDRGFVVEDGVVLRLAPDEFMISAARPNLAHLRSLIGYEAVEIDDVSDQWGTLAVQGPAARTVLAPLAPEVADLAFFELTPAKLADIPVTVSRTGYTGGLGYEVWVPAEQAVAVWDAVAESGTGHGLLPFGQVALLMARIEAGLLLIDVDFESSRFAFNDEHRSTPLELGFGWMFRDLDDDDRNFIGRPAIERERAEGTSRWKMVGLVVDWLEYDTLYNEARLIPPKDHIPVTEEFMLYDADDERVGYATSFMYSPMLQRHIALARLRPDMAATGTRVDLEVKINHRYHRVGAYAARLPLYKPDHKTA